MGSWSRKRTVTTSLAALALYFTAASYLKYTYIAEPKLTRRVYLKRPFIHYGGYSWYAGIPAPYAATAGSLERSELQLYENGTLMGPRHSPREEIAKLGGGRYSYSQVNGKGGVIFSAADNSSPDGNHRSYFYIEDRCVPPQKLFCGE